MSLANKSSRWSFKMSTPSVYRGFFVAMVLCPLSRAVNSSGTGVIPALTSTFLTLFQQESLRLITVTHEINTGKGNLTSSHGCILSSEWKNRWFLLETSPSIANVGPNWSGVCWRTSSFEAHRIVRRCHPLLYHIEVPLPLCHNRDLLLLQTDNVIYH